VAIKLLDPAIAADPDMLDRFLREARAAAALRSMHVVQIFDYGVDEGVPYIAMELLVGESLRERLDRARALSFEDTARLFSHLARAVAKAHDAGIVHRDLKPDNVFLVRDDEETAKVLDFGIAKVGRREAEAPAGVETASGTLLGTPYYMSPEQARGEPSVDFRSDLWSLAVIAFECLTGSLPFENGPVGDVIVRICTTPAPRPSTRAAVPEGFDAWFARGVAPDPNDRFQSAREMSDALWALCAAPRETATPRVVEPPPAATPTLVSPGAQPPDTSTGRPASSDIDTLPLRSRVRLGGALAVAGAAVLVMASVVLLSDRGASARYPEPITAAGQAPAHVAAAPPVTAVPTATPLTAQPMASSALAPAASAEAPARRGRPALPELRAAARASPKASGAVAATATAERAPEEPPAPASPRAGDGREIFSDRE
jgi:serine/threonine-protein kinase